MARNDEKLFQDGLNAFANATPNTTSKSVTRTAMAVIKAIALNDEDDHTKTEELRGAIQTYLFHNIYQPGAKAGAYVDLIIENFYKILARYNPDTRAENTLYLLRQTLRENNTIYTSYTYTNGGYRANLIKLLKLFGSVLAYFPQHEDIDGIKDLFTDHINRKAKKNESLNALLNGFIAAQAPPDVPSTSLLSRTKDRVITAIRRDTTQPAFALTAQEARHPHTVFDALLTALDNASLEHDLTKAYCASLKAFLNTPNVGTIEHYARGLFVITCTFLRESFNNGYTTDGLFDTLMECIPKLMDFGADSDLLTDCIHFLLSDESNLPACSQTTLEQLAILISATADYHPEDTAYDLKTQYANRISDILTRFESPDEAELRINLHLPAPYARAFLALQRCEGKIARRSNTEQRHRRHFQRLVREGENSQSVLLDAFIAYCQEFIGRGKDCREVFETMADYLPPIIASVMEANTPNNIRNLIHFLLVEFVPLLIEGEYYALEGDTLPHNIEATIQILANLLLYAKLNAPDSSVLQNVPDSAGNMLANIRTVNTAQLNATNKDYLHVLHTLAFSLFQETELHGLANVCLNALLLANETGIEEILSKKFTHARTELSLLTRISQGMQWTPENHDAFNRILVDLLERILPADPDIREFLPVLNELVTAERAHPAMIEALCVCVPGLASAFNLENLFPRDDARTNMLADLTRTLRSRFRSEDRAVRPINLLMLLIQQKRENPAAFSEFDALGSLLHASKGLREFPAAYETLHDLILDSFDAEDSDNETVTLLQGLYHAMHRYVKEENHHRSKRITKKLFNFIQVAFLITTHNNHRLPLVLRLINGYMIDLFTLPKNDGTATGPSHAVAAPARFAHPGGMYRLCLHWMQTLFPHGNAEDQAAVRDTWHNAEDVDSGLPVMLNAYTYDQVNEDEDTALSFDALAQYVGMLFASDDNAQDNAVYQAVRRRNQDLGQFDTESDVIQLPIPVETIDAYFTPPVVSTPWYSGLFGGGALDDGDDVGAGPVRRLSFGGSDHD